MMAENHVSSQSSFTFRDFISPTAYNRYFDIMKANESVFSCVIQDENQVNAVYIETPHRDRASIDGVVRVFMSPEDAARYARSVAAIEQMMPDMVGTWEMKFSDLVEYAASLDSRYKSLGKKGIRVVASTISTDKFIDLDVLWTAESNLMV